MTPYWDCHFFSFFLLFFRRLPALFAGEPPTSDEIQLLVLGAVALSSGILSPFLVLQRFAMLANSLSHTMLLGIVLAALAARFLWGGEWFATSTLLLGGALAALLTVFCTEGVINRLRLQLDASIGLVFTGLFGLALLLVNLFLRDVHLGVDAIMGHADALQIRDAQLPACIAALNALAVFLFFKKWQILSFDPHAAKLFGFPVSFFRYTFFLLLSLTCMGAFRAVGVIVVLSLLTGPYLIARLFCAKLPQLLFWTPLIGIFVSFCSVALSRHLFNVHGWALSTGGILAFLMGLLYFAASFGRKSRLFERGKCATLVSSNKGRS